LCFHCSDLVSTEQRYSCWTHTWLGLCSSLRRGQNCVRSVTVGYYMHTTTVDRIPVFSLHSSTGCTSMNLWDNVPHVRLYIFSLLFFFFRRVLGGVGGWRVWLCIVRGWICWRGCSTASDVVKISDMLNTCSWNSVTCSFHTMVILVILCKLRRKL
jgi:hypothetical protein